MANQIYYLQKKITYADTSAKTIGQLPANAYIVDIVVENPVAYNVGSGDFLDIGDGTTVAKFADNIVMDGTGKRTVTSTAYWGSVLSTTEPTSIVATYVPTGTAPTAGESMITVMYAYNEN
jgi:hypothetical protein